MINDSQYIFKIFSEITVRIIDNKLLEFNVADKIENRKQFINLKNESALNNYLDII